MKYTSLMYHQIEVARNKVNVYPRNFVKQMDLLVDKGIKSLILGESMGEVNQYCLLTFDDGHKSNMWAAEELRKRGLTGYFYVIKDLSLNNSAYLCEDEIRQIHTMGHKIGVHGKNHGWWTKKSSEQLVAELRETKTWIEDVTGSKCITCSAPGGDINRNVVRTIQSNLPDLTYIRTSRQGVNAEHDTVLKSVGVHTSFSDQKVLKIAQNDKWYMREVVFLYYLKEMVKPVYHQVRRING